MPIGDQDYRRHEAKVTVWACPGCGATSPPQIGEFAPPPDDTQLTAANTDNERLRKRVNELAGRLLKGFKAIGTLQAALSPAPAKKE